VGEQFHVRLPAELENALRRKAQTEDRPAAGIVRQALRQYLADELADTDDKEVVAQAS
jgi:predicted transcriptional regulator